MIPMTASPDEVRDRIAGIRDRLAMMRHDKWSHEFSEAGEQIIITRAVMDAGGKRVGDEAPVVLCVFGIEAAWHEKNLLRDARDDMAFVLDQLTGAGRMIRDLRARVARLEGHGLGEQQGQVKNLSAEASIKCSVPAFQTFLREKAGQAGDGDLSDKDNCAAVLRRALNITSRKELNTDPDAASRWRDMRAEFSKWMAQ